ncbi:MAG: helix-turn-helix domain-containing protein [Anaerolineae bacterium]|nr:helix-turn-helix domain-containing protein [Anaerolineae bacterium]
MPPKLQLDLEDDERHELLWVRDHHDKPYMRERASAVLQIADGDSAAEVARDGLLRPRRPNTVRGWYHRYLDEGVDGLEIREGRGRKPAFSP